MIKKFYNGDGGIKELLKIAFPMIVSSSCETMMIFTDRLFLSKLGSMEMAASMMGGLSVFVLMTFFIGLTGYSTAMVGQFFGAKQYDKCSKVINQAFIISLIGYPILLAMRPFVNYLFFKSGISTEQLDLQIIYFSIVSYTILFALLRNSVSGFFSGIGETKIIMYGALISTVVNIFLNYVLIFGKLGFPVLGIRGAAYGTVIGGFVGLVFILINYFSKKYRHRFNTLSISFNKEIIIKFLRFGSPAGLEMFINVLAFQALVVVFHSHSQVIATASTIMLNWDMVSFVPLIGIQVAVTSLVARYVGESRSDISEKVAYSGLRLGMFYALFIFLLFTLFAPYLVDVFKPNLDTTLFDSAREDAIFMVRFAALYVSVDVVFLVFTGALRGAGDTLWSMFLTSSLHILLVPTLYIAINVVKIQPRYGWISVIVLFLLFSSIIYKRFKGGRWKSITVIDTYTNVNSHDNFMEPVDIS